MANITWMSFLCVLKSELWENLLWQTAHWCVLCLENFSLSFCGSSSKTENSDNKFDFIFSLVDKVANAGFISSGVENIADTVGCISSEVENSVVTSDLTSWEVVNVMLGFTSSKDENIVNSGLMSLRDENSVVS